MNQSTSPADNYEHYGFSLKSVCWGYRDIFQRILDELFQSGYLGAGREEVTGKLFELLKQSDQGCFDHVAKQFLTAMNTRNRWLLELPGIFADVVDLGSELARVRLHYGISFFECLSEGGFGDTPEQVRYLTTRVRQLRETDDELAIAFLKGYAYLLQRLNLKEMDKYIDAGLQVFNRNRTSGLKFMQGELKTSETYIRSITKECRLTDISENLERLLRALVDYDVEVDDLGKLDSDELFERGSSVVCMYQWLYVPAAMRLFDNPRRNRDWYTLLTVTAAGMLAENSFSRLHGHPAYTSCTDLVGSDVLTLNLFQILEYVRVLRRIRTRWPGAKRLLTFGLETEYNHRHNVTPVDKLFFDLAITSPHGAVADELLDLTDKSVNCFDTAARLSGLDFTRIKEAYPGVEQAEMAPFSFLPDFLYPGEVSAPPTDALVADMKDTAERSETSQETEESEEAAALAEESEEASSTEQSEEDEGEPGKNAIRSGFLYDEWSVHENDYYQNYCIVHEHRPQEVTASAELPEKIKEQARRVSRVFEQFKPQLARYEKYLEDGDEINQDILLDYLVRRRKEPSPKVDFYETPRINQRDLSVLILLDASGSTGENIGSERIIDLEKHAGAILGEGLAVLGDRFAMDAFSSNGREDCRYTIYKDFEEQWGDQSLRRLTALQPAQSTRIGPALRHAGYRLTHHAGQQRLIILITDGRPRDTGYDPNTRYAQYDVRMACEENRKQGVHTFAISTEENSFADMEIMFPRRRFAILADMRELPRVLPRLYRRLTLE